MIRNKLRKLDSIATETKDVQNLKYKTGKTNTKVNDLEKTVEFHDQDISDLQKDL